MCWVAIDRAIKIAKKFNFPADLDKWTKCRDQVKDSILENGYNKKLNSFVKSYGSPDVDASLLLLALKGFLPIDDPRIQGTIHLCKKHLLRNGFMMRYTVPDGFGKLEGAFVICNFWLVQSLAMSGRVDEAYDILVISKRAANRLGIFSEEYDYKNNRMLGNLPQAFSHIGFINATKYLSDAQSK
jgi:GH15 family glucan-1,4-alpha-glucosidase